MPLWEESEVTNRRTKKVTETLDLIQDDWPGKPKGVMFRTHYQGVARMVLSEQDWLALRDFIMADAIAGLPDASVELHGTFDAVQMDNSFMDNAFDDAKDIADLCHR